MEYYHVFEGHNDYDGDFELRMAGWCRGAVGNPGYTLAFDLETSTVGIALCCSRDFFSRKKGRAIAEARIAKRSPFWSNSNIWMIMAPDMPNKPWDRQNHAFALKTAMEMILSEYGVEDDGHIIIDIGVKLDEPA